MIRLIAAIDRSRGIAKQGVMPWHIPNDFAYFSKLTKDYGGRVLVGGTTYRSIAQALEGRTTYVLTREDKNLDGVEIVRDLEKFLKENGDKDLWVIGGANVFAQILELGKGDELYLTHIEADFGCNQFFPPFLNDFGEVSRSELHEQNGFVYSFVVYARKMPATSSV